MANGGFDPLHIGHLLHLEAARAWGSFLLVALTSDATIKLEKGNGRPLFREEQREQMLRALRCVDEVVVVDSLMDALSRFKPSVFVKGCDYEGRIKPEHEAYCAAHGIRIRITETPKWSATEICDVLRAG